MQNKKEGKTMGHLQIHCDKCGTDWSVYRRDDWKDDKARTCPVCGAEIDSGTWERQVLSAFAEMEDVALELVKDHMQYGNTLFTIGYVPDVIYTNREKSDELMEEIVDVKHGINDLQDIVTKLVDSIVIGL